jgi:predicted RNA binding protein YcfA (HicA-like mRNA interferase family)
VLTGGTLETGQVGGHCQPQLISERPGLMGRGLRPVRWRSSCPDIAAVRAVGESRRTLKLMRQAPPVLSWLCSTVLLMAKAARVLAALKRDGWTETRRSGSHRVLVKGDQQRIWAYHDGVDLGGPAMARIARDYGYTLAELRKL